VNATNAEPINAPIVGCSMFTPLRFQHVDMTVVRSHEYSASR
jgi:hypothetical protein